MFEVGNMILFTEEFILDRHFQFIGCDEMKCGIEMRHSHQQGVYGTSVF